MEDKLDEYIRETNKGLKNPRVKANKTRTKPPTRVTGLKRWAASAAMDLFKFYLPLILLALSGGICLMISSAIAIYFFYAFAVVLLFGIIFCAFDFYHYNTWTQKICYTLEGWDNVIGARSSKYWDMNGEHWLSVKIVIVLNEPVNEKHFRVLEAFLKKLRKRLNQWTVSQEKHFGYSEPNGWAHDGMILAGDMNPRVLNLIRKRFSGELHHLCKLMPGTINKVVISPTGSERYHEVYVDPSSD
jgi:hypothetical protein